MSGKIRSGALLGAAIVWLAAGGPVEAILFYSTGDPAYHTNAPAGELAGSGWELQGRWIGNGGAVYCATPIGPHHFLAAKHVGGRVGTSFLFQGVQYPATAVTNDPLTDLALWRVCGTFPQWAGLYTNRDEAGRDLVAFGRGTLRGDPVTVTTPRGDELRGWRWGGGSGVMRWGENRVEEVVDGNALTGGTAIGELLRASFDADGGPNECHLSVGDSSGAVFIHDGTGWRLAGVHYSVDGPYSVSEAGTDRFEAALFDQGGLYVQEGSTWTLVPDRPQPQPSSFYSTRVSSRIDWIEGILAQPLPPPVVQSSAQVTGGFADEPGAVVDESLKWMTVPLPDGPRFYRLHGCEPTVIRSLTATPTNLVIRYGAP